MQATNQTKLLKTLGIHPQRWTLWPSLLAALIASPLLTTMGTCLALFLSGKVAPLYGIGNVTKFWQELQDAIFPVLRVKSFELFWTACGDGEGECANSTGLTSMLLALRHAISNPASMDLTVTYTKRPTIVDTLIELATYPPIYHLLKAKVFILIIVGVAECVARMRPNLTPRGVPSVITISVVTAGLLVILADWAFSQLWLLRH